MKAFFNFLPIVLCFVLSAAHFNRAGLVTPMVLSLVLPLILFWHNRHAVSIIQLALFILSLEWLRTLVHYANIRIAQGEDWLRLAIILGVVAVLNFATVFIFRTEYFRNRYTLRQ